MPRPMRSLLKRVSGRMSLHMPAAQGRAPFRPFPPYRWDTTELPVTDDLYRSSGAIAEAEKLAARSAHAAATLMVPGGSTAGLHAMLLYACKRGDTVVFPRNVHLSCLNLCATAGLTPVFAEPSFTPDGLLYTTPEAYAEALDAHPDAAAALALHGDYYGLLPDLAAIARETHARGRLLLCDEAHGAYFNWRSDIPNAGECGADLYVQSAHKTLPALTPGAWLHAGPGMDAERLRAMLRMVQTSSPSFLIMLSLDEAREWMDQNGQDACKRLGDALRTFHARAAGLGYHDGQANLPPGVTADPLRLVLCAPQGGEQLQRQLQARGIDVEMCDRLRVVCILSLLDGPAKLMKLWKALRELTREPDARVPAREPDVWAPERWPARRLPIGEAAFAPAESVPVRDAAGRVSAVSAGLYPPGVAWLTPGDEVTLPIAHLLATTPPERLFGLDADGSLRCIR
ncbi:MAG TPA: DegT/DnrJ/EryC1/StrS family aminotransferase [Candidatus Limiplasma sp.]|nr:DegT/DnrJ/EryC1/StrS family aminotransferase [Candidatus Limiplasma sp.]HPR77703.1 DegT/DnrJ/EryC1/StrS family aminotransferase [Candidatus Limiplasma sp.]